MGGCWRTWGCRERRDIIGYTQRGNRALSLSRPHIPVDRLTDFARRWNLAELALFGSILRDDFRPDSDIDVLIQLKPGDTMSLEKFMAMRDELMALFGREVDLVEKPLLRNPIRRREIL